MERRSKGSLIRVGNLLNRFSSDWLVFMSETAKARFAHFLNQISHFRSLKRAKKRRAKSEEQKTKFPTLLILSPLIILTIHYKLMY